MPYGMEGSLKISKQTAFNSVSSEGGGHMPIISESLATNIEQIVEESMRQYFDEPPAHEGILSVAGDISFEPQPTMIGHILRGITGQASVGAAAVSSAGKVWEFVPTNTSYAENCALPPYTLGVYRGTSYTNLLTDAIFHTLAFDISGGAIVKATVNVMARVSSADAQVAETYDVEVPYVWSSASLQIGTNMSSLAAFDGMENMTITIDNPIEGVTLLDTTKQHGAYDRSGFRTVKVSGTMRLANEDQYEEFRAQSEQAFVLTIAGGTAFGDDSTQMLTFEMPKVRYDSYPVGIGGPGRISVGFEGSAKYDQSSGYAIRTTLVNTQAAY